MHAGETGRETHVEHRSIVEKNRMCAVRDNWQVVADIELRARFNGFDVDLMHHRRLNAGENNRQLASDGTTTTPSNH